MQPRPRYSPASIYVITLPLTNEKHCGRGDTCSPALICRRVLLLAAARILITTAHVRKYSSSSLMFNGGLHPRASQYRHLLDYSPDVTQVISSSLFSSYSLQCTNFSFPVPLTLPFSHRNVYLSEGERGRKNNNNKEKKNIYIYIYIYIYFF